MKKRILFLVAFTYWAHLSAQQMVINGRILFERKENLHKQFENRKGDWAEEWLKRIPKYQTDIFELVFSKSKSYYYLKTEDENNSFSWGKVAHDNLVLSDFNSKHYTAYKNIFDKSYVVDDSLEIFKWKMTGEYRNIAGYDCRKATTIILDSIYIIAFYSDQIAVKGGPESFNGLPGMILGLVIPRINLTYFATKVEAVAVTDAELQPAKLPKKAKPVNRKNFMSEIISALKDWGEYASRVFWKAFL